VEMGRISLEITRATERFHHRSRRRVARPASMPLAKMFGPESTPIPIRRGYCLITGSCTRSFTARWIASFTQLSSKRCSPGVPSSMLRSTRKQNRSKEKASKRCPRPKHACADPNGSRLDG
jgi:hypothetical protein